jgi:hypothetical protein
MNRPLPNEESILRGYRRTCSQAPLGRIGRFFMDHRRELLHFGKVAVMRTPTHEARAVIDLASRVEMLLPRAGARYHLRVAFLVVPRD